MKEKFTLSRLIRYVDKALIAWCTFIMGIMCLMVILSVFFRYVLNITYTWSEELIVFLFITTTYFGAILCVRDNEHIDVSYFRDLFRGKAKKVILLLINLVCIVIQVALAIISFRWIQKTGSSITVGLKIQYYYIYSMFPVCFFSMALYQLRKIVRILINWGRD